MVNEIKRYRRIDGFKFILSLLVVGMHTSVFLEHKYLFSVFTHLEECAIPFFAIFSGFFYTCNIQQKERYASRFVKHILLVYVFWSIIWYVFVMTHAQYCAGHVYLNLRALLFDQFILGPFWYYGAIVIFAFLVIIKNILVIIYGGKIELITISLIIILCILCELNMAYSWIIEPNYIYQLFSKNDIMKLFRRIFLFSIPFMFFGHYIFLYSEKISKISKSVSFLSIVGIMIYIMECIAAEILGANPKTVVPYFMVIFVFIWLITNEEKKYTKMQCGLFNYLRNLSGVIYCVQIIPIYYYNRIISLYFGRTTVKAYVFTVAVSIVVGSILYYCLGKKLRKIIA